MRDDSVTAKQKAGLLIPWAILLFAYIGLSLSTGHADAWYRWREQAANVVGLAFIASTIIVALAYAPRVLARLAQVAVREVLEETEEGRARRIAQEARSTRAKAIGLGVFLAAAAIYECFFTPDAQYSRVRRELDRLEGHEKQAIAGLVERGRDLESARFVVATRIQRLHAEADRLWPETKAAKKVAPQLPPSVLRP